MKAFTFIITKINENSCKLFLMKKSKRFNKKRKGEGLALFFLKDNKIRYLHSGFQSDIRGFIYFSVFLKLFSMVKNRHDFSNEQDESG